MSAPTLTGCLPDLIAAEKRLASRARALGITYRIADFGALRTEAQTNKILGYRKADYAVYVRQCARRGETPIAVERWRPIAPFGSSFHNYGAAFDVLITASAKMPAGRALETLGSLAALCGLRWGGTFKTRKDPPHFELPITLAAAKQRWATR